MIEEYDENFLTESNVENRKKHGLESVKILYIHLAKFVYQPYNQSASWCGSISNAYKETKKYFNNNGVINSVTEEDKEQTWLRALDKISQDTGIPKQDLPQDYPFWLPFPDIITKEFLIGFIKQRAITNEAIEWIENPNNINKFK